MSEPAPVDAWSDEFTADQALTPDPNPVENPEALRVLEEEGTTDES
jgi:hypothetical protein